MNKNLLKELQDLIKRIEKYEVIEKDCKNSLSLQSKYDAMEQRIKDAAIIKASNVKSIEKLTKDIESVKHQVISEPDENQRKTLYDDMKRMIEEKNFLEMSIQFKLTPQLAKESAGMELSEEYNAAYSKEWGRYSTEGINIQAELKELVKKIDADIQTETNKHPFVTVKRTAEAYRYKR